MAETAERYGFGARAAYAEPRASEHSMKERVRLSGRSPRVNDEPMTKTLSALVKEFEKNAALGAILERRRALEGRSQYVLQSREAMDNVNRSLAPWARTGRAVEANSARVAQRVAGVATSDRAPDAADVMTGKEGAATGKEGTYSVGGSESSTRATVGATTNPSEVGTFGVNGQGNPQTTLNGRLGKSKPQRIRQTRSVIGKGALSNSLLSKWRARSVG